MKKILILIFIWHGVNAECDTCQANGVACVSQNSYQMCFGGSTAHLKQTFQCLDGMECTDLPSICFRAGGWKPSCEKKCGVCNSSRVFACTGPMTFAFCFGSVFPSNVKGTCPIGYVCDSTSSSICVLEQPGIESSCPDFDEDTSSTYLSHPASY